MAVSPVLADRGSERLAALDSLVSPYGVVAWVGPRRGRFRGPGELVNAAAMAGWEVTSGKGTRTVGRRGKVVTGSGRAMGAPGHARLVAIAEAAERYAGCDILGEPRVWAKAAELDGPVLDPGRYPRCSAAEYSAAECPVRPFDPDARIRWVRGLELTGGGPVWVPAAMACYKLRHREAGEHFSNPISTGYAVHTDPVEALVGGICEVIERDALALVWRQRLPIPLAGPEARSPVTDYLTSWAERHFIQTYMFDATTDLGVPTAYCLQVAEYDQRARHVIGCATARNMARAAEKALIEAVSVRGRYYGDDDIPSDYAKFSAISDGARYMGTPERSAAFGFLVDGAEQRPVVSREALPTDPDAALARLTAIFAERVCEQVDELAFKTGRPWLPVVAEHPVIRIGPWIAPPAAPCYVCYQARRVQHDEQRETTKLLHDAYDRDMSCGPAGFLPHHARTAAGIALSMIEAAARGTPVTGRVVTAGLTRFGVSAHHVVPVHGCARCSPPGATAEPDLRAIFRLRQAVPSARPAVPGCP